MAADVHEEHLGLRVEHVGHHGADLLEGAGPREIVRVAQTERVGAEAGQHGVVRVEDALVGEQPAVLSAGAVHRHEDEGAQHERQVGAALPRAVGQAVGVRPRDGQRVRGLERPVGGLARVALGRVADEAEAVVAILIGAVVVGVVGRAAAAAGQRLAQVEQGVGVPAGGERAVERGVRQVLVVQQTAAGVHGLLRRGEVVDASTEIHIANALHRTQETKDKRRTGKKSAEVSTDENRGTRAKRTKSGQRGGGH